MANDDLDLDRMDAPASHKGSKGRHGKKTLKRKEGQGNGFGRTVLYIFLVLLALVVIVNIYTIVNLKKEIQEKKVIAEEELRPANINLYVLKDQNCTDCLDLSPLVGAIKNARVKILVEKEAFLGTDEAKHLITTYGLKRAPAIVVTGEISRTGFTTFETRGDGLVYEANTPPYTDAITGQILGHVTATILNDSSCNTCFDISQYLLLFKNAGIVITDVKNVDIRSAEGEELVHKYAVGKIPSAILSEDLAVYPNISRVWAQLGTVEADGSFVLREANPPYKDLDTNKIRGLAGVTYLVDNSCTECYSVLLHKQILTNFGLVFGEEKTYDIASDTGKEIVAKFNITKIPTIILNEEGNAYPSLVKVWNQVGTIDQGNFIFRRVESLGVYKDLNTGLVVGGKKEETQAAAPTENTEEQS